MTKIYLNETFKSIQGEGPSAGKPAFFIRGYGCGAACTYCDSAFTWRTSDKQPHREPTVYDKSVECIEYTVEQLVTDTVKISPNLIVLTGGEPLIQAKAFEEFIDMYGVINDNLKVEVETAGILKPLKLYSCLIPYHDVSYNVSPKLESSGNPLSLRYKPEVLKKFCFERNSIFKFVVTSPEDLIEIQHIIKEVQIPNELVYLMAEGETQEKQLTNMESVVRLCIDNNYNFSPRLHTLIWGKKRGV